MHASKETNASPPSFTDEAFLTCSESSSISIPLFPFKSITQNWMVWRQWWPLRSWVWTGSSGLSPPTAPPALRLNGWPSSSLRPGRTAPCCRLTGSRSPSPTQFGCSWTSSSCLACSSLSPGSASSGNPAVRTCCLSLMHIQCSTHAPPSTTQ